MEYHLDRKLSLKLKPKPEGLYAWAINETDEQAKRRFGGDQIPWHWSLYFTAVSCEILDTLALEPLYENAEIETGTQEVEQPQLIRLFLRPGVEGKAYQRTAYSMFGTSRVINNFLLEIRPIVDPTNREICTAWGSTSYTSEIEFRKDTVDDTVLFSLYVTQETFARYLSKLSAGFVTQTVFRVARVSGFYSDWSPTVRTDAIKILTQGEEHAIDLPNDLDFEPPRLGRVGQASLHINQSLAFGSDAPKPQTVTPDIEVQPPISSPEPQVSAQISQEIDPQMLKTLRSLKRAMWFIAGLLALIFITLLAQL